ncbi:hypothetical protein ES288_D07G032600v1 [Gossypium darwinii]|uniref:Replication termination factor 2 n=1 Tax=Gossypium darwinii TaxID=34276 RepID=A0A5D2BWZ2_GOSDA|nr:hypothetical protein ES288_D07G032600v1 [Gossypium darwinii]
MDNEGDGGATGAESRDCYLKMYAVKKPDKVDPNEQRFEPCVIDKLGNIFNKEALVQALLGKKFPKGFRHIKGFKGKINIKLMVPCFSARNCGHVVSAKALKEVKSSACLVCHKEFVESDKVVINGREAEVAALREMMKEEKAKTVKGKKKRAMDVLDGEKGFKGLSNGEMKFRAADAAQAHATKQVYALIFTSSKKSDFKETFTCRSLPLGRN